MPGLTRVLAGHQYLLNPYFSISKITNSVLQYPLKKLSPTLFVQWCDAWVVNRWIQKVYRYMSWLRWKKVRYAFSNWKALHNSTTHQVLQYTSSECTPSSHSNRHGRNRLDDSSSLRIQTTSRYTLSHTVLYSLCCFYIACIHSTQWDNHLSRILPSWKIVCPVVL